MIQNFITVLIKDYQQYKCKKFISNVHLGLYLKRTLVIHNFTY